MNTKDVMATRIIGIAKTNIPTTWFLLTNFLMMGKVQMAFKVCVRMFSMLTN